LSNFFSKKLYSGLRAALPARCLLCRAQAGDALACAGCRSEMPRMADACPRCALPSPDGAVCGDCFVKPPPLRFAVAAFRYAFPVDRMVKALKYSGELAVADWFGDVLAAAVADERTGHGSDVAAIVALPLAPARQRLRGFNHAGEIARRVAHDLNLRCDRGLIRVRDTPPQASLPWAARARNLRNAFAATRRFDGARLALVDDVMTTGATLHEAARALRHAGAQSVDAWVVARTLR
jgi:ComF family protein